MAEGEGTVQGTPEGGTGAGTGQPGQVTPPAWVAQLPEDLRANETFTSYKTIGDLGKTHLDVLGKVKELDGISAKLKESEGKLANSIPKLPQNPTKEQIDAFYGALGRPTKPEEYGFPKGAELEHDETMVKWAQNLFWETGLSKAQAEQIGVAWDKFLYAMLDEELKAGEQALKNSEAEFKAGFKNQEEATGAVELVKRFSNRVLGKDFIQFCVDADVGQPLFLMKAFYEVAKKSGEDIAPPSRPGGGGTVVPGMIYDQTPQLGKGK